ncbi:MAG: type I phosphomannose isomerase catalytic subunit [Bacteroidales bacterium]
MKLYPLKFNPILKEITWGGSKLSECYGKKADAKKKIGESWELSGVTDSLSVVANGALKGNNIQELVQIYMGELLGQHVYERFGEEFPLLVKLIDANDTLSVQVHPDDATAAERHHAYGKTEMWYVLENEPDAKLAFGFRAPTNAEKLIEHTDNCTVEQLLNFEQVQAGDTFFIPAGCIHAIGKGIVIAEIQQTSDITYRVYDWGRDATNRPLHMDLAVDVINYGTKHGEKIPPKQVHNQASSLVDCPYFTTNLLAYNEPVYRNMEDFDSFVIYLCIGGSAKIISAGHSEEITMGETILIPASIANIKIEPQAGEAKFLEVYIKSSDIN